MEEKTNKKEVKKPTYEELNNYCTQLFNQNKELVARMRQMEMGNLFKRLDYLFCVLQNKSCFNADFILQCTEEIMNALSVPEEEEMKGE